VAGGGEFHWLSYRVFGPRDTGGGIVLCLHGFNRTSQDFTPLAERLARRHQVICVDLAGRGQSERLQEPHQYRLETYVADLSALLGQLAYQRVYVVGTSLGAHIGLVLAGMARSPVRGLVLNDIGPYTARSVYEALETLASYQPPLPTFEAVVRYVRKVHRGFGRLSEEEWQRLARSTVVPREGGGYAFDYDPRIFTPYVEGSYGARDLWSSWDALRCPVLCIQGALSPVLSPDIVQEMRRRKPDMAHLVVEDAGHAPTLSREQELSAIEQWLAHVEQMPG
jgi:pimeloyl-ACP methyl ester carboxylesterase